MMYMALSAFGLSQKNSIFPAPSKLQKNEPLFDWKPFNYNKKDNLIR